MIRNIFQPTAAQPDPVAQLESFRYGWELFTARQHVTACHNAESRRGWYAALDAFAVATLPATSAEKMGF
jgi:hypothetical protein